MTVYMIHILRLVTIDSVYAESYIYQSRHVLISSLISEIKMVQQNLKHLSIICLFFLVKTSHLFEFQFIIILLSYFQIQIAILHPA